MIRAARILLLGYGLAAVGAGALAVAEGGVLVPLLVFWLGGAACVLAIALVASAFTEEVAVAPAEDGALLEEALARWEADRFADSPVAENRPARVAGARDASA
jgi:hypothetical protein